MLCYYTGILKRHRLYFVLHLKLKHIFFILYIIFFMTSNNMLQRKEKNVILERQRLKNLPLLL